MLDTLARGKYFSTLNRFSKYNQIQIAPEDCDKTMLICPLVTSSYFIPTTFQQEVIGIFSYFIHEYVAIYVDNFTTYGDEFDVI